MAIDPPLLTDLAPAGNRAISSLIGGQVQRQNNDGEAGPDDDDFGLPLLNDEEVAKARRFYTSQPGLYTPAIISQLRIALRLTPDGGVDDELVLAVANFQVEEGSVDEPALKVDGMAGPRTLPRIFRGGLKTKGEGKAFGGDVQKGVVDEWAKLATPEERLKKLVELVNKRLVAAGVPMVTSGFEKDPNNLGSFDFGPWTMLIGRDSLGGDSISEENARELSGTVYHEARHTEQWFRMAQLRAGQGLSGAAIAAELGIPLRIAALARAKPLKSGTMEAVIAQGWWDSVYGARSAHREAVQREMTASSNALRAAEKANEKNPSPQTEAALQAAQERRQRAFDALQNLPEENDAFATEHEASEGISGGSPTSTSAPAPAPGPAGEGLDEPAGSPPALKGSAHETLPEVTVQ